MEEVRVYKEGNYLVMTENIAPFTVIAEDAASLVTIHPVPNTLSDQKYTFTSDKFARKTVSLSNLKDGTGAAYTDVSFTTFYRENTGFNTGSGGSGPVALIHNWAAPTGITASSYLYDEGWQRNNNAFKNASAVGELIQLDYTDARLLKKEYIHAHKFRFVGSTGGYYDHLTSEYKDVLGVVTTYALAFPNDYVIDIFCGCAIANIVHPSNDFETSAAYCNALSFAGFQDWRPINTNEFFQVSLAGLTPTMKQPFLGNLFNGIWLNTPIAGDATKVNISFSTGERSITRSGVTSTTPKPLPVRNHF